MSSKPTSLAGCLEVARFPWTQAWIEWNENARAQAMELLGPWGMRSDLYGLPKKVGVLVKTDKEGRKGTIFVAWSGGYDHITKHIPTSDLRAMKMRYYDLPSAAIPFAEFDFDRTEFNPANFFTHESMSNLLLKTLVRDQKDRTSHDMEACSRIASIFTVPYTKLMEKTLAFKKTELQGSVQASEAEHHALAGMMGDLCHEMLPFIGITLLFCAKNAISVRPEDRSKLNKQRLKSGKSELKNHGVVYMRLNSADRSSGLSLASNVERRMHSVKGHFVRRGPTIFWRRQHIRWSHSSIPVLQNKKTKVTSGQVDVQRLLDMR
jgi:hypothetical protein